MEIIILDGRRMNTVCDAHKYLAKTMRFPMHYGENLDALYDCLSELGRGVNVILTNTSDLRASLSDYADRLLNVFKDASSQPGTFRFIAEED